MTINEKLGALRESMKAKGIHAYMIPSADPHLDEYVPDYYRAREWISGFTGSAGTVVVTMNRAILWTDGRYYIQAAKEIQDSEFELFKKEKGVPDYMEFLEQSLTRGQAVGLDGRVVSCADVRELKKRLERKGVFLKGDMDLVSELWTDRPPLPMDKAFLLDVAFAGLSVREKRAQVLSHMKKNGVDHYIVSAPDSIAWFLNLRGNDVSYTPVILSYLLISGNSVTWFVDPGKLTDEVRDYLRENDISVRDYGEVFRALADLPADSSVLVDSETNSYAVCFAVKQAKAIDKSDIIVPLKAVKNPVEIRNLKDTYVKDGVAMVNFLYWLDTNVPGGKVTELNAAEKLLKFRMQQKGCMGCSFGTIAGYNANAAMMHYTATPENYSVLKPEGTLLVDSGGQYSGGTTDITRTIVLGEISEEEKRDFTLVLKSHIAMASAIFLEGTSGKNLDVLARQPVWKYHMDYKCGTGHGVGFCLGVHEGPHGFSNNVPLVPGMIITIEPGVYKENRYGIRTENDVVVVEDKKVEDGQFYRFDMLTWCPIDIRAMDPSLLNRDEIGWINTYHKEVCQKLSPYLGEEQKSWLRKMTSSI
ncbi:aminopeptidase P family protein [Eubacteriales bacterium mix99]